MALAYSTTLRNTRLDSITTAVGTSCLIRIYNGTRPATGGSATTLLAELTGGAGSFAGSAASGVLTLSNITQDALADNTGTATWFRILTSGATFVIDGNVGTSGSDLNLTTTSIVQNQPVSISNGATITEGNP